MEHKRKSPKYETSPTDGSHHQLSPQAVVNLNSPSLFPPDENGPMKQEFLVPQHQAQHAYEYPAMQEQTPPPCEVRITLFQWQIQQEARKVEGLSQELLYMQDADGDTYV